MGLGRGLPDDEQSVLVQNARKVDLADGVSIQCKTADDAEVLKAHLASLSVEVSLGDGLTVHVKAGEDEVLHRVLHSMREDVAPAKRAPGRPRKAQD